MNYAEAKANMEKAEKAIVEAKTRKSLLAAREEYEFWENKACYFWSQK